MTSCGMGLPASSTPLPGTHVVPFAQAASVPSQGRRHFALSLSAHASTVPAAHVETLEVAAVAAVEVGASVGAAVTEAGAGSCLAAHAAANATRTTDFARARMEARASAREGLEVKPALRAVFGAPGTSLLGPRIDRRSAANHRGEVGEGDGLCRRTLASVGL